MRKANLKAWNDLPDGPYLKTMEEAQPHFRDIGLFPGSLGIDHASGGYLAIHRAHSPSALEREIPVCLFLKNRGFRVLLEPESAGRRSPDCRINERIFEIKQITRTKNIHQSLIRQLRTSYFKANRVLIHICQPANLKQLEGGLAEATHKYKKMEEIWIVKDGAFFTWEFATKKLRRAAP